MPTIEKQKLKTAVTLAPVAPRPAETTWIYTTTTIVPEIALYYGFSPIERLLSQVKLEEQDQRFFDEMKDRVGELFSLREKIALLRKYFAKNPGGSPIAVFSEKSAGRGDRLMAEYHLDIIGTARPTAEALLMKLCYEIAREFGSTEKEISLEINSVGERESFSRFSRDITGFFKKHLENLHADCRHLFKKSPFAAVGCSHSECQKVRAEMPESVSFLSEPSRQHFMGVLEHLEAAGMPYSLNKELIVEPDIVQHSIFRVSLAQPEISPTILARGSRWGGLARRMGFKKDVLGASAIVRLPKEKVAVSKLQKKMRAPAFYFIHIGHDALLKSLTIIEDLRRAKIAVHHSLLKDKMAAQLGTAEHMGVPYVLIMGQKESVEGTAVVREVLTRCQETVPLSRLADYLKKLKR